MIDPSPAPTSHVVNDIEGAQSTSPAQGVGLVHRLLDPSNVITHKGRVDDIYMDRFCAVVSLYNYRRGVPCLWTMEAFNRWVGVKTIAPPTVGTEVHVVLSNDHKYGWIVGVCVPTADPDNHPSPSLFYTSVSVSSDLEAHNSETFGFSSFLMNAFNGTPVDVLPGDKVQVNGHGVMMATLELTGSLGAGPGCSVETHVLDQLIRVTGWNLQERTSMGERQVLEDHGHVTTEIAGSHLITESLGNDPEMKVPVGLAEVARRFQELEGHLGGLLQRWIMRPNAEPVDMSKASEQPDIGLFHHMELLSGFSTTRSVVGGGFLKVPAIAVPKKKAPADSPSGDRGEINLPKAEAFEFDKVPETPAAAHSQLRDFIAHMYNRIAVRRLQERSGDWVVPDEAECPALSENLKAPGVGKFFRDYPEEVDAMQAGPGQVKDPSDVMKTRPGLAWNMVLPDGSLSVRDIWGSGISTSGGHLDLHASKDIRVFAGRNVIIMGGHDVVIKGRESVDITSTNKQLRIKSQGELFIHSEAGGMLISLGSSGRKFAPGQGEDMNLPGICVKVPKGGFIIDSAQVTMNLDSNFFINGRTKDSYPTLIGNLNNALLEFHGGGLALKNKDDYAGIFGGSFYLSGSIQAEGDCYVKGVGVFSSEPLFPGVWDGPTLKDLLEPSFEKIDQFQYPYTLDELKQALFGFRTEEQYSAQQGKWFETFWQREMDETVEWKENAAADGSYPYPGKDHYKSAGSWWKYAEANVEKGGRSKERDSLSATPTGFTPHDWNSVAVHP